MSEKVSGRVGYQVQAGQGGQGGWIRVRYARVYSYSGSTPKHKGIFGALRNHVFDYVQKAPADQMITTCENIGHHVGTINGHNIINDTQNNKNVIILKPNHTQGILGKHQLAIKTRYQ